MNIKGSVLVVGLACMGGCDAESSDEAFDAFRSGGGEVVPPPTGLSLPNGLHDPTISGLDPRYGLYTPQGLDTAHGLLTTEDGRNVVRYLVECALPADYSMALIVGDELLELHGLVGLAPEWRLEACDEDCQQWVSACLLARTNPSDHVVTLWISADHPAVGLGSSEAYPLHEATYYGNLFADAPTRYSCLGTAAGQAAAIASGRACVEHPESCGLTTYDDCVQHQRCIDSDGFYTECAEGATADGEVYQAISVFVSAPE